MIAFEEALAILKSYSVKQKTESVDLYHALDRILAEDIHSDVAMPPFNKSAMDGFACRKSDLKNPLVVIEEIPAGTPPAKTIGKNQCARIMTGAMVPVGADFVVMNEHAERLDTNHVRCIRETSQTNICLLGEDVKIGDLVLKKGERILPSHIAILASVGRSLPLVYRMPSIAIISTGNELVEPVVKPGSSKIRNSNGYQMYAQIQQMGILPVYLGIVRDDQDSLEKVLASSLQNFDVTLISGGVSVGDFDFVPKILSKLGVHIPFHGMDVKPGKHLLFGEKDYHFVFGMPGNPVSSFVQLEVMVKPFLAGLMGRNEGNVAWYLPLEEEFVRTKGDQLIFIPAITTIHGTVLPVEYHGSAHIHSYIHARVIMEIPIGTLKIKKGGQVRVRPI
ncbi:MAG: molybdopterin molybdotransferase MoeA [Prolixibacteraceae bacterium]|jgi:molybdopterin molybdotransferase|nr:molybdopterin molybdotransferase MoeA [Prolixibacteraceae bacterium]